MTDAPGLKPHPLAELFPLISGADFEALCADIRANGLRQKIVLHEGMILDGRNRLRACKAVGAKADFERFKGGDPLAFVLSLNLARRHLNETQRAVVAARLANMGVGRPAADNPANLQNISRGRAADLLHVSERSVASAAAVMKTGVAELQRAAEQGVISVSQAAVAAMMPAHVQAAIVARAEAGDANAARTAIKQAARAQREQQLATKQRALPQKKFGVIYADPEWRFDVWSEAGLDRAADNHYPTSDLSDICARDVQSIAAEDCVLFLWGTVPCREHAMATVRAWGFRYKSEFVWRKDRAGTGYWNRNEHEYLIVATRGSPPAPAPGTQWGSVVDAAVGRHSAKPEKFAELIEAYFPSLPKIELNRRGPPRPGWDAWGNEADARGEAE